MRSHGARKGADELHLENEVSRVDTELASLKLRILRDHIFRDMLVPPDAGLSADSESTGEQQAPVWDVNALKGALARLVGVFKIFEAERVAKDEVPLLEADLEVTNEYLTALEQELARQQTAFVECTRESARLAQVIPRLEEALAEMKSKNVLLSPFVQKMSEVTHLSSVTTQSMLKHRNAEDEQVRLKASVGRLRKQINLLCGGLALGNPDDVYPLLALLGIGHVDLKRWKHGLKQMRSRADSLIRDHNDVDAGRFLVWIFYMLHVLSLVHHNVLCKKKKKGYFLAENYQKFAATMATLFERFRQTGDASLPFTLSSYIEQVAVLSKGIHQVFAIPRSMKQSFGGLQFILLGLIAKIKSLFAEDAQPQHIPQLLQKCLNALQRLIQEKGKRVVVAMPDLDVFMALFGFLDKAKKADMAPADAGWAPYLAKLRLVCAGFESRSMTIIEPVDIYEQVAAVQTKFATEMRLFQEARRTIERLEKSMAKVKETARSASRQTKKISKQLTTLTASVEAEKATLVRAKESLEGMISTQQTEHEMAIQEKEERIAQMKVDIAELSSQMEEMEELGSKIAELKHRLSHPDYSPQQMRAMQENRILYRSILRRLQMQPIERISASFGRNRMIHHTKERVRLRRLIQKSSLLGMTGNSVIDLEKGAAAFVRSEQGAVQEWKKFFREL